jgi:hypothetical protein
MSSSPAQSRRANDHLSSENVEDNFSVSQQTLMSFDHENILPGSYDDTAVIRGVLLESMKRSGLTRAAIADEMSFLLGRQVTEKMLNAFSAESRGDRRWPAEFDRAFCKATGDNTLLTCRVKLAKLHVIDEHQMDILELGRAFLRRSQADEKIALLQRRLAGRTA